MREWQCSLNFHEQGCHDARFSEGCAARISVKIMRFREFRVTIIIGNNDRAAQALFAMHPRVQGEWLRQTPASLGFWLHHSPGALGGFTDASCFAALLFPKWSFIAEVQKFFPTGLSPCCSYSRPVWLLLWLYVTHLDFDCFPYLVLSITNRQRFSFE